ncbi:porin family protein [Desulfuromonas versatilis]|nr:porin family protein [Desulfuromonas versatilis]
MRRAHILWAGLLLYGLGWGANPADAANYPRSATLSPFVGYQVFEGNQNLEDDLLKGLSLGCNFNERWSAEVTVGHVDSEARGVTRRDADRDVWNFFLSGIYHFRPDQRFVPYLLVGAGGYIVEGETGGSGGDDEDEDLLATYGLGVKIGLSEFVGLRGEVRHVIDFNINDERRRHDLFHGFAATLGLHFQLVPDDVQADSARQPAAESTTGPAIFSRLRSRSREEPPLVIPDEAGESALARVAVPLRLESNPLPPTSQAGLAMEPGLNPGAGPLSLTYALDPKGEGSGLSPQAQMEIGKALRPAGHRQVVVEVHSSQGKTPLDCFKTAQERADKIRLFLVESFELEPTVIEARGYAGMGHGSPDSPQTTLVLKLFPRVPGAASAPEKPI